MNSGIEFKRITEFKRGTLYSLLVDAYSFDSHCKECWNTDWKEFDDYFFDNPHIADNFGFVTTLDGKPIGHISWDPRHNPDYVQIGHNCIASEYKGRGYGKMQLQEALNRIKKYVGLKKITVNTNSKWIAPKNYESVGFKLYAKRKNDSNTSFSGDYLYYEILL